MDVFLFIAVDEDGDGCGATDLESAKDGFDVGTKLHLFECTFEVDEDGNPTTPVCMKPIGG